VLVDRAAALDRRARTVFFDNGGDVILGLPLDGTRLPSALNSPTRRD